MSEERDTRSYSERYAKAPEPPPPPPPSSGSIGGRFLAVIGVGLLAAVIVAAFVLRGSGSPTVTTATTPSPTTATTSTGPTGPTAAPDPGALALKRFWTLITDPKLSYHLETTGGGRIDTEAYTFRESLDVAGDSWKGSEQAHGLGYVSAVQLVVLDTVVWIKGFDGAWSRNIEHDPYFRARPLLDLESILALNTSGTVVKGGKTLYVLKANTNYQPYPGRLIGFVSMGALRVDTIELSMLVTEDGVPVEADVHILAGGVDSQGKPLVDAKATRTFSKVGATFTITDPKP